MSKKELSQEELVRKDFRFFIQGFNQLIKRLTDMVYITDDGKIFMKRNSTTIERYGRFYDMNLFPIMIGNLMYDTKGLAEFFKLYRYSASNVIITDTSIEVDHTEKAKYPDAKMHLDKIPEDPNTIDYIMSNFYKRMPDIMKDIDAVSYIDITENQLIELEEGNMLDISGIHPLTKNETHIYVTKASFPLISNIDKMEYAILPYRSERDDKLAYIQFRETIKNIGVEIYTITAAYQSI